MLETQKAIIQVTRWSKKNFHENLKYTELKGDSFNAT